MGTQKMFNDNIIKKKQSRSKITNIITHRNETLEIKFTILPYNYCTKFSEKRFSNFGKPERQNREFPKNWYIRKL